MRKLKLKLKKACLPNRNGTSLFNYPCVIATFQLLGRYKTAQLSAQLAHIQNAPSLLPVINSFEIFILNIYVINLINYVNLKKYLVDK